MATQTLPNVSYTAGSVEKTISIPDFVVTPANYASICPSIVHSYTHDPQYPDLFVVYESKSIRVSTTATTSVSFIRVTVTQKVPYGLAIS